MGFRAEPVLDIARGLSAFTSVYMVGNQIIHIWKELFIDRCAYCKGAGRVTCPHCGGTKTMRRRPGEWHYVHDELVDRKAEDQYQCIHCGPMLVYDLVSEAADQEKDAFRIMDNVKDAYSGKYASEMFPFWLVNSHAVKSRITILLLKGDPAHIIETMKAEYEMTRRDWEEAEEPVPDWVKEEAEEERSPLIKKPWEEKELPKFNPSQMRVEDLEVKYVDESDSEVSSDDSDYES